MSRENAEREALEENGSTTDHDDEAEIVLLVQASCEWARHRFDDFVETDDEYEKEQYERFKKKSADQTKQIKDDFFHATACHKMIALCMHAQAFDEAQEWFGQVREDMVRDIIKREYPELTEPAGN